MYRHECIPPSTKLLQTWRDKALPIVGSLRDHPGDVLGPEDGHRIGRRGPVYRGHHQGPADLPNAHAIFIFVITCAIL
eukprot:scaffold169772_cov43-Prasinocladus_malaysianus.AAC.1